jgi:ABC-2 type transport system permease protein
MNETMANVKQGSSNEELKRVIASGKRHDSTRIHSAIATFATRALLKIKHVPEQMIDVILFPIVFLLMFTFLFGGAIAGSTGEYLQFLLPGILVMTITQISIYTGIDLNNDIQKGIFDRFRTLPIWIPSSLIGAFLVDIIRYSTASTVMIALGLILGFRPEGGISGVILAVVLTLIFSFCLSWVWTTLAMIMRSDKSLMMVSMMVLFPLSFVSNVFVEPETLPAWIRGFVDLNPISLLATGVRGFMHGTATIADVILVYIVSVVILAIFAPLTMYLYRKKA